LCLGRDIASSQPAPVIKINEDGPTGPQQSELPKYPGPGLACSHSEREATVSEFERLLEYWKFHNDRGCDSFGCWSEVSVLPALWIITGQYPKFTYVDIGANKGESISAVLKYWVDLTEHFALEVSTKPPACGFDPSTPIIYAIEPMSANVNLLHKLVAKLPKTIQKAFHIEHAAMGLETGETCMTGENTAGDERGFSSGKAGTESCPEGQLRVPLYNVSTWAKVNQIDQINYLKIDVEGFDPDVVLGAEEILTSGMVDMLSFEYHELNLWQKTSLESLSTALDNWGYDTYVIGDFHLYRINNGCWDGVYERRQWSNILSIRKNLVYHERLLKLFHRTSCIHRALAPLCNRFAGRLPSVSW